MKKRTQISFNTIKKSKTKKILFDHPILKFAILIILNILFTNLLQYFPRQEIGRIILLILSALIAVYFILVIIYLVRRLINNLTNPKNIFALLGAYALFILGILLMLSTLLNWIDLSGNGYIKYGGCSDKFNPSSITTDPQRSTAFFYFSTITFFTVGYGDLCPMGFAKFFSIFAAFLGHMVSVVLVALIINNYFNTKRS